MTDAPTVSVSHECANIFKCSLHLPSFNLQVLGFVVMVVGIVTKVNEGKYMLMSTDNTDEEISTITTMLIVIGLLICIVGVFGAVGAFLAETAGGRGVLLLVGIQ